MDLLLLLLEHRQTLVSRDDIAKRLWEPGVFIDLDAGIRTAVLKIRQMLGDSPRLVETVSGKGYRFVAPVEVLASSPPRSGAQRDPVSIAVLPFRNVSSEPDQEYWSDGLTEEITSVLSRMGRLRVVSRTSAFAFKGRMIDVREIGRLLGVTHVVEGSVRRIDSHVRVGTQLIDVKTGTHLWSEVIEGAAHDAWGVQQEVAAAIVEAIRLRLTPEQRRKGATSHESNPAPEAFELYLKAKWRAAHWQIEAQRDALTLFERAHAADAHYALPLLGAAQCLLTSASMSLASPRDLASRARAFIEHAIALDPGLADAHAKLAQVMACHEWDWTNAEAAYHHALEIAPYSAEIHNSYATSLLGPLGRFDEALAESQRARELDPFSPVCAAGYAGILVLQRRFEEAEVEYRRQLAERPYDGTARIRLSGALAGLKRYSEAVAELETLTLRDPSHKRVALVTLARAHLGERDPARTMAEELQRRAATEFVPATVIAFLHAALGQIDEGVEALERAYHNREDFISYAGQSFMFDGFRSHPRFQRLLDKIFPAATR